MRRLSLAIPLIMLLMTVLRAQEALTTAQRESDLKELASLYAKHYAPYEWKRDVVGFDLLRLTPWLQRVHHADDLDFQEALIEFIASLNDAHDVISFPSNFSASIPLTVDIYDGKVLIDSINRAALPQAQFPFTIGDEVLSVDGQRVEDLILSLRKYSILANPRSTNRLAAAQIFSRSQQFIPHVMDLDDTATVAIRLASTGATNTHTIPWRKLGIPITSQGPLPSPRRGNGRIFLPSDQTGIVQLGFEGNRSAFRLPDPATVGDNTLPLYMQPVLPLLNASVPAGFYALLNFGSKIPIYGPPPGFVQRLGGSSTHFFLSGTFPAGSLRIGLIRIPSMAPPNVALALQQLDSEIAFFNQNTDALIVDVMRNPGGLVSFTESLSQRFFPTPFRTMGVEVRATATWVTSFASVLTSAELSGAPPEIIENLRNNFTEVLRAYDENRGRSAPISLNSSGSLMLSPAPGAYTKPLMVLTDELSASAADAFPAIIQDNHRGPIFGMRTMGAGGTVVRFNGPAFTESLIWITTSLMNRGVVIQTPDFPPSPYIENVGVRPNIVVDYMTRDNLVTFGAPFVAAFTQAIVNHVQNSPH